MRIFKSFLFGALIVTLTLALPGLAQAQTAPYEFQVIDVPGAQSTRVFGISAKGDIVGFYRDSGGVLISFVRHRDGTVVPFQLPGAIQTVVRGINAAGDLAGDYTDADGVSHGFVFRRGVLTNIDVAGSEVFIRNVDDAGVVIGDQYTATGDPSTFRAFTFHNGTFAWLSTPGVMVEPVGFPCNRNTAGAVVGTSDFPEEGSSHAYVIWSGVVTPLTYGDAPFTAATAISPTGVVVGHYAYVPNGGFGWIWKDGVFTDLEVPFADHQINPKGINARAEIVGTYRDSANKEHSFLATPKL
jgi:hypothetical protein